MLFRFQGQHLDFQVVDWPKSESICFGTFYAIWIPAEFVMTAQQPRGSIDITRSHQEHLQVTSPPHIPLLRSSPVCLPLLEG